MMAFLAMRRVMTLLAVGSAATSIGGCGRTLVFAESDGVNLAIRANASSETPVEVNFGLNRTVGTIVPPAGQKKGGRESDGEAVNMFAGFEVNANVEVGKIEADLTVDTQFASGAAAKAVSGNPAVVARIVSLRPVSMAMTNSAKELRLWLRPNDRLSPTRSAALQKWLDQRYPPPRTVRPFHLYNYEEYEEDRVAALKELRDIRNIPIN